MCRSCGSGQPPADFGTTVENLGIVRASGYNAHFMEGSRLNSYHPIKLEIYRNLFSSIAQEMGTVLRRTAYSPNIKERRDYSCALFDDQGQLVAMGDHMPVHLGSMPLAVQAALDAFSLDPGDVVVLNDPFAGSSERASRLRR